MADLNSQAAANARRDSFTSFAPHIQPRQQEIMDMLGQYPAGLTAWEISDMLKAQGLNRDVYVVRPRLTALRDMQPQRVVEAGTRYEPRTDRQVAVWALPKSQLELF